MLKRTRVVSKLVKTRATGPKRIEITKRVISKPPGLPKGKVLVKQRRVRVRIDPL